jgi:hypothetical protein
MNSLQNADVPPIPLLVEGLISEQVLQQLFLDLVYAAAILSVQVKHDRFAQSSTASTTLDDACEQLKSRNVRAVQIRYLFDGSEWFDTIIRISDQFRVVRCQCNQQVDRSD